MSRRIRPHAAKNVSSSASARGRQASRNAARVLGVTFAIVVAGLMACGDSKGGAGGQGGGDHGGQTATGGTATGGQSATGGTATGGKSPTGGGGGNGGGGGAPAGGASGGAGHSGGAGPGGSQGGNAGHGSGGAGGMGGKAMTGGGGGSGNGGAGGDLDAEAKCRSSGGSVEQLLCCANTSAFPGTCLVGACTCAPTSSHMIAMCACPANTCFDPAHGCVARP